MNPNFDDVMWSSIFDYGGLTSSNAIEIGLVDTSPPVDPISYLLDVNVAREDGTTTRGGGWGLIASLAAWSDADDARARKEKSFDSDDDVRKKFETNFGIHDCYRKFNATESVSLAKYLDMLNRRDEVERTRGKMKDALRWLSGTSFATSMILSAFGLRPDDDASTLPTQSCDRIAVLTVDGNIDSGCASRVIRSLREIRKDVRVKAVVLRVDSPGGSVVSSEAMLEEIKLLDKVREFPFRLIRRWWIENIRAARSLTRLFFMYPFCINSPLFVRCQMPRRAAGTTSRRIRRRYSLVR